MGLIGATLWGFIFGPMWLGLAGLGSSIAVAVYSSIAEKGLPQRAINHLVKKRRRGWGERLTDQERAQHGSLMVFEPVCLVPDCDGAVVAVMSNGGLKSEPFVQRRSTDGFYSQGPARCVRCGQKYVFTVSGDSLGLSDTLIGPSLRGNFPAL